MLLGGFWHGASWNFIFWGILHGTALAFDKVKNELFEKIKFTPKGYVYKYLGIIFTFNLVCFSWVYFRAPTMEQAGMVLVQITSNFEGGVWKGLLENYQYVFIIMLLGFLLHFIPLQTEEKIKIFLAKMPLVVFLIISLVMVFIFTQIKTAEPVMPVYLQF